MLSAGVEFAVHLPLVAKPPAGAIKWNRSSINELAPEPAARGIALTEHYLAIDDQDDVAAAVNIIAMADTDGYDARHGSFASGYAARPGACGCEIMGICWGARP
jgi:hypothetical protein